jgi:hypothetical protein
MQGLIFGYDVRRNDERVGVIARFIQTVDLGQVVGGLVGKVHDVLRDEGALLPRRREARGNAVFPAREPRCRGANDNESEENSYYFGLAGRIQHQCGLLFLTKNGKKSKDFGFFGMF